jgi:hypothetical protein
MSKSFPSFSLTMLLWFWAAVSASDAMRNLQSSNARVIAEAYECDEYLNALPDEESQTLKKIDYEIRVCIRPVTPTLLRGITMRSINEFTWFKPLGSTVQPAVRNGYDQPRTLQVCVPGRPICSLKTKLRDDFFFGGTNATVTGTGTVSMQVQHNSQYNPLSRRQLGMDENGLIHAVVEWVGRRRLQVGPVYDGFAGQSGVKLELEVEASPNPHDLVPKDNITTRWEESPSWLRALIIGLGVVVIVIGCCLGFNWNWSIRDLIEEQVKKGRKHEETKLKKSKVVVPVKQSIDEDDSPWQTCDPPVEREERNDQQRSTTTRNAIRKTPAKVSCDNEVSEQDRESRNKS